MVAQALLTIGPWNVRLPPLVVATILVLAGGTLLSLTGTIGRRALLAVVLGITVAMLLLSGTLVAALVATIVLAAAFGYGATLLRLLRASDLPESDLYAIAIGLGVTSYATLALALAGVLFPSAGIAVVAAGILIGQREVRRIAGGVWRRLRTEPSGRAGPLLFAGCVWAIVLLVEAVAPEVQYDALSYHLGLPRVWIDAGGLIDVPEQIQSYYYLAAEMNFTLAMLLAGPIAAKLVSLIVLGVTIVAVHVVARDMFSVRVAVIAAALFATTPAIAWQGTTTYVDVAVTLYVFLGAYAALRARRLGSTRLAVVAGLLLGLGLATKVTAVLTVAPIALILVCAPPAPAASGRRRIAVVLAFAAALALALAPWPLLRYVQTGNPVFPLFNGVFHSPLWPAVDVVSHPAYTLDRFGLAKDPVNLAALPFALSYAAELFDDGSVGAAFGISLLLVPLALIRRVRSPDVRYLAFISLASFALWSASVQYARYLLPAFAGLTVLAAVGLADLGSSARRLSVRVAAAVPPTLMVMSFPLILFLYPYVADRIPYAVAFGAEPADAYLARTLPTYRALRQLAVSAGRDSHVLLLSFHAGAADDEDRLYAPGRVETISSIWTQDLVRITDAERALATLRDRGITHLYINRDLIPAWARPAAVLERSFVDRWATEEYRRGSVELYRIRATPRP